MINKKRTVRITLLAILCFTLLSLLLALPAHAAEASDSWTDKQIKAHQIAETAREMGLPESDPIIVRAQELFVEDIAPMYTDEDATMIAKTIWAESRGIASTTEKACVAWCILNRVDAGYGTIAQTITAPNQFAYDDSYPVWPELLSISYDVLTRWESEKYGETEVGRVLPGDYLWYNGDGRHNWFRNTYKTGAVWDYSLPSPYID